MSERQSSRLNTFPGKYLILIACSRCDLMCIKCYTVSTSLELSFTSRNPYRMSLVHSCQHATQ